MPAIRSILKPLGMADTHLARQADELAFAASDGRVAPPVTVQGVINRQG